MAKGEAKRRIPWRLLWSLLGWALLLIVVAYAGRRLHAFVKTDPQFKLEPRNLSIQGAVFASRSKILRVFDKDFGRSLFLVPLPERRRRLLAVDWVEDAIVSRVWPDRMIVRISERRPVAFVSIPSGQSSSRAQVALIDAFGVILERPAQGNFAFPVLKGVLPTQSERERRRRVAAMLALMRDLGPLGARISEVDAASPDSLTVVAEADGATVQLALGEAGFRRRLESFLEHFPEIRRSSPEATVFDLRIENRITAKDGAAGANDLSAPAMAEARR
jgi:cell division protein FtsQ